MKAVFKTAEVFRFETVQHSILLSKLEHYGVRDKELNLLQSFLTDKTQFIEIDSIRSEKLPSLNFSKIQGSKLSCILYICYVSEVTILRNIMDTPLYYLMTQNKQIM